MATTKLGPLRGSSGEVRVRFARARACEDAAVAARAEAVLADDEQRVLARLRPAKRRLEYLAAHALARTMLAELAGCDPARLRLRSSPWGRPEAIAPAGARRLSFSISRADGIALCATTDRGVVGADVESLRHLGPDPLGVAEVVCCPEELDVLRALSPSAGADRFLSLWTLKEACAKAKGLGFHIRLDRIVIHREDDGRETVAFGSEAMEDASTWRLRTVRLTPHHAAGIAVCGAHGGRDPEFRIEEDHLASLLGSDGARTPLPRRLQGVGRGRTLKPARVLSRRVASPRPP